MRHGRKFHKLQRKASHRKALLANLAVSLILNGKITTTIAKAKALRPYAEKLITLAKRGDLHARRQVVGTIHHEKAVKALFANVASACAERQGGYLRITRLPARMSDAAIMAVIEFVDDITAATESAETASAE